MSARLAGSGLFSVEGCGELRVPIPDQESEPAGAFVEVHQVHQ
jgi:hypothetical protein